MARGVCRASHVACPLHYHVKAWTKSQLRLGTAVSLATALCIYVVVVTAL